MEVAFLVLRPPTGILHFTIAEAEKAHLGSLAARLIHGRTLQKERTIPLSNVPGRKRAAEHEGIRSSGSRAGHRAFVPAPLPPPNSTSTLSCRLSCRPPTSRLGRLDGATKPLPDPDLFVLMYIRREAVVSSHRLFAYQPYLDLFPGATSRS